jgi:AcrR family transcriptional regulator
MRMRIDTMTRRERQRVETRAELVAAAHAIVKDEGYESLTIRKLAERVGLATMSVYSYFSDKQAILTALAQDSFEELARRCDKRRTADPLATLKAGLEEYVSFAIENPNEYRTIFMTPQLHEHEGEKFEELEASNPAFQSMLKAVRGCIEAGKLDGDPRAIATILWTVAHGAASLVLTFPLYPFGDPNSYAGRLVDLMLDGIARHRIEPLSSETTLCRMSAPKTRSN